MSMMEKISETLHIGGHKKEEEHKKEDKAHAAGEHKGHDHPAGVPCSGSGAVPPPAAAGYKKDEEHKAGEEKKHEGFMEKIKKKKKDRKERKEGEGKGSSSSSSDSD
ncbi:hypothetical protein SELMODRAFT_437484 [Selaginella moellendorffii]|uniref:Uncharacterized protein n=1 Tax=Selaginella moellendorffii TaxID=88036 RepID=D8QMH9_SELML|nr:dehydrin HIRD11 [Selaginella moellendorffii]EFJ37941.1 hypothetical protein SELMODRAFT_437484 [Selaginella moellendorffii]|eukprot:XP_002960402.1 dehydrin HIRD11 [Selaginella moellendorffii]